MHIIVSLKNQYTFSLEISTVLVTFHVVIHSLIRIATIVIEYRVGVIFVSEKFKFKYLCDLHERFFS